jgi:hypothetical protein
MHNQPTLTHLQSRPLRLSPTAVQTVIARQALAGSPRPRAGIRRIDALLSTTLKPLTASYREPAGGRFALGPSGPQNGRGQPLQRPRSSPLTPSPSTRPPNPGRPQRAALSRRRRRSPGGDSLELSPTSGRTFPSPLELKLPLAIGLSLPRSLRRNRLLNSKPKLPGLLRGNPSSLLSLNGSTTAPVRRRQKRQRRITVPTIQRIARRRLSMQKSLARPAPRIRPAMQQRPRKIGLPAQDKKPDPLMRRTQNIRIMPGQPS